MTDDDCLKVAALEQKLTLAQSEANAWKSKNAHHFRLGTLLAEGFEKQLTELHESIAARKDAP